MLGLPLPSEALAELPELEWLELELLERAQATGRVQLLELESLVLELLGLASVASPSL